MKVLYSNYELEIRELKCENLEEGEKGVKLYDEDTNLIGYIIYDDFLEAVPDDQE